MDTHKVSTVDDMACCLSCSCVQVAGSAAGISAFQMDIKVEGITLDIMKQVRQQSLAARHMKHALLLPCLFVWHMHATVKLFSLE
jgi:hypothetical protein